MCQELSYASAQYGSSPIIRTAALSPHPSIPRLERLSVSACDAIRTDLDYASFSTIQTAVFFANRGHEHARALGHRSGDACTATSAFTNSYKESAYFDRINQPLDPRLRCSHPLLMSGYKNFAVIGAGNIGAPIAEELLNAKSTGAVDKVIILARPVSARCHFAYSNGDAETL